MDRELQSVNMLRKVDWRYQIASRSCERGLLVARSDHDAATYQCARYLRQLDRCHTSAERQHVAQLHPDLHEAIQILKMPQGSVRFVLEARLLTGNNVDSIALAMSLRPGVVRFYACMFFDVWDRLHCADVIVHHVIGWNQTCQRAWCDVVWKLVGYLGGQEALDQLLHVERPTDLGGQLRRLHQETRIIVAHKIATAARRLHLADDRMALALVKMAAAGNTQQREVDVAPNGIEANIQAALEAIDFAVGTRRNPNGPLADFDGSGVELRSEELLRVAIGETLPDAETLKNVKFPSGLEP